MEGCIHGWKHWNSCTLLPLKYNSGAISSRNSQPRPTTSGQQQHYHFLWLWSSDLSTLATAKQNYVQIYDLGTNEVAP